MNERIIQVPEWLTTNVATSTVKNAASTLGVDDYICSKDSCSSDGVCTDAPVCNRDAATCTKHSEPPNLNPGAIHVITSGYKHIAFTVGGCSGADYIKYYFHGPGENDTEGTPHEGSSGFTITKSNLTKNTTYSIGAEAFAEYYYFGEKKTVSEDYSSITETTPNLPAFNFSRSVAVGQPVTNLRAVDWNRLIDDIKELAKYLNRTITAPSYVDPGDVITASTYNSVVNALNACGSNIRRVDSNTYVTADHFLVLKAVYNDIALN